MKTILFVLLIIAFGFQILILQALDLVHEKTPIIQTKYGAIAGYSELNSFIYLGIPYAQPPINELRWISPQDAKPWSPDVLNATKFQSACPQVLNCDQQGICPTTTSEDCLYLNIFVPQTILDGEKKAVLIFIHGGNFQFQGANEEYLNSALFSSLGDVIVVTINYRLGVLGFLVTGLESGQIQGNFGILDQKQAIQWVYNNIEAFGGDNQRITLFGHSSGSQAVVIHLLSSNMQPYFTNAIIQSSPMSIQFKDLDDMITIYSDFATEIKCKINDIDCLRKKSAKEIVHAQMNAEDPNTYSFLEFFEPWLPWIDGTLIKAQLIDIGKWLENSKFSLKPLIIGSTTEESIIDIYSAYTDPIDGEDYIAVIFMAFNSDSFKILAQYPVLWNNTDQRYQVSELATRYIFSCSSRNFLETYIALTTNDTNFYMYVFDFPLDFNGWGADQTYCKGHTCHGVDLPYTFDVPDANFTSIGHSIALDHIQYWSNFAKYQSPNGKNGEDAIIWPKYDSKNRRNLRFASPENIIESMYLVQECDFLDTIGYVH